MTLKLPYTFKNKNLLNRALTHSSYVNECSDPNVKSYERLEFLGDAVLELAISEELFDRFPERDEGVLTKMRAAIVCEESLSDIANELDLGRHILFSSGESNTGGADRPSTLCDVVESIIAAVFLDGGYKSAKKFILNILSKKIDKAAEGDLVVDYKSELQMICQTKYGKTPRYHLDEETGPDHDKTFKSSVWLEDKKLGEGSGKSKKHSEQVAAKKALKSYSLL